MSTAPNATTNAHKPLAFTASGAANYLGVSLATLCRVVVSARARADARFVPAI